MFQPITKILIFVILNKTVLSFCLLHKNKYTISNKWKKKSYFIFDHVGYKIHSSILSIENENENETNKLDSKLTETNVETNIDKKEEQKEQCIIMIKDGRVFCKSKLNLYLLSNEYLSNKELITISPGGLKGFYLLGILSYIKDHYETDHFIYSGASAGSWNCLFMCLKGNPRDFIYDLMQSIVTNTNSIMEMQYFMKYKILSKYKTEDFDLKKIFIGVSKLEGFKITSNIFTEFNSLEDAVNCCMASSHIPIITGGLTNKYNNMYSFDGGLSNYPYLNKKSKLHVFPGMWKKKKMINVEEKKRENIFMKIVKSLFQFSDFFSMKKNNPIVLFDDGYHDAKMNREYLDELFVRKKETTTEEEMPKEEVNDIRNESIGEIDDDIGIEI